MATFDDNFDRANGALGANWATDQGTPSISSNAVVGSALSQAHNTVVADAGYAEASCHCFYGDTNTHNSFVFVKGDGSATAGFGFGFKTSGASWVCALKNRPNYGGTDLATYTFNSNPGPWIALKITWDNGTIKCYVNGALVIETTSALFSGNTYMGISCYQAQSPITDFRAVGGASLAFDVSPDPVGNYGTAVAMTATGTGTAWTPGTPGSPTFTVNHGTISNQVVAAADSASFDYDPGDYLGYVIFTDPSTGEEAIVLVSSDPNVVNPGANSLSETVIAWLEEQASHVGIILKQEDTVTTGGVELEIDSPIFKIKAAAEGTSGPVPNASAPDGLAPLIWLILNGGFQPATPPESAPYDLPIAHGIDRLHDQLDALTGNGVDSLDSILNLLGGDPFASHQTILTEIRGLAVGEADLQPMLDALDALRGDSSSTVKAIQDSLAAYRTGANWTLTDVKQWIEAVTDGDDTITTAALLAVIAALALAIPTGGASLAIPVVATGGGALAILATLFEVASLIGTVSGIASDIITIKNSLTAPPGSLPLWPGVGNVTLGDEVALVDQLVLAGPMHGVLVNVTTPPSGLGRYNVGGHTLDYGVGRIAFATDNGRIEPWQYLGFREGIFTPRCMEQAETAYFQVLGAAGGTARTWLRS